MLIRDDVIIDFPITSLIRDDIKEMEEALKEDNWYRFCEGYDSLEGSIKLAVMGNQISLEQAKKLLSKYVIGH